MLQRIVLTVLAVNIAVGAPADAQATTPDSSAIATAVARAIRSRIPESGPSRGAVMETRPSSAFASAEWNRLVGLALRSMDTALVATPPTPYTIRVNIVRVSVWSDSVVTRVAFTQCRDTARGLMFGGSSYDYVFRRVNAAWSKDGERRGGTGDGRC